MNQNRSIEGSGARGQRRRSPASLATDHRPLTTISGGYTLIEILVATALTLLVLGAMVQVFGTVSESISDARSFVEKVDQLRTTQRQLKQDLEGVTAPTSPPLPPELGLGYFEYVEGPWGPVLPLGDPTNAVAVNIDRNNEMDSTQGDVDDVLMFTTRSRVAPFLGRPIASGTAAVSQLAEVAWFVRGRTLYRRVLLIAPSTNFTGASAAGFYNSYDVSARYDPAQKKMVANTLADLTRPENRFAHTVGFTPANTAPYSFPPHPHNVAPWVVGLKLPTLCESTCCNSNLSWNLNQSLPVPALTTRAISVFDAWRNPYIFNELDATTGNLTRYNNGNLTAYYNYNANRASEDVILTNVIGFDVKAWDPGAPIILNNNGVVLLPGDPGYIQSLINGNFNQISTGAYVDLNYLYQYRVYLKQKNLTWPYSATTPPPTGSFNTNPSPLSFAGAEGSGLQGSDPSGSTTPLCSVYDTWCSHFENYSVAGSGYVDYSHNGFDNDNDGVVNDPSENLSHDAAGNQFVLFSPPYPTTLRGIQVKIRVYEPDSRQVREVTVTQCFFNE